MIIKDGRWILKNISDRENLSSQRNPLLENLLMGYQNELKNRFIHVDYKEQSAIQSANVPNSKSQNGTLKMSLEEIAIIKVLHEEPSATQKRIAELTGKSERTIKRRTVEMQEKGLIRRENGKRNGRWEVLVNI